jgi:uncharacterized membrane protein YphA (DoxX/SURF4 family)
MQRINTLPAARALALLRIASGLIFIVGAAHKMKFYAVGGILPLPVTAFTWQVELPIRLSAWLANHHSGVLVAIVRDLLLPHGALVAGLLTWVELLAGVLLVLGLRTRLASVLAGIVSCALVVAGGGATSIGGRPYLLLLVIVIVCILGDAGQIGGMDGWRRERSRDRSL